MNRQLIRLDDADALRRVGIPWTVKTLREYRLRGMYPRIFVKIGKLVMIDVTEFERSIVDPAIAERDERADKIESLTRVTTQPRKMKPSVTVTDRRKRA